MGDLVLVKFPQEESGKKRHGLYRITQYNDLMVAKQFFPEDGTYHSDIPTSCLSISNRHSAGRVRQWIEKLIQNGTLGEQRPSGRQEETSSDGGIQSDEDSEPILMPDELESSDTTCLGDDNDCNILNDHDSKQDDDSACRHREPDSGDHVDRQLKMWVRKYCPMSKS